MHAALQWVREKIPSRLLHVIASLAVVACVVVIVRRPASDPVLRIGIHEFPPYQVVQPGGAPAGAAVAVLSEAANRAHVRLVWSVELEGADAAFEQGKVDLWPQLESTADRARTIHVSPPWIISEFALITRKDAGLKKVEQVAGKRVAFVMNKPSTRALVEKYLPRVIPVMRSSRSASLRAVCAGDAEAAFLDSRFAQSMLLDRPAECESIALRYTLVSPAVIPLGIASTKSRAQVADRLADEIRKMGTDGTLASILSDWYVIGTNDTKTLRTLENLQRQRGYLICAVLVMAALLTVLTVLARRLNIARDIANEAMRAKASFLTNMSHEIRTPMNGVVGMTNLLFTTDLTDEQREYAEEAQHSADSLLEMLNNILDYSRMDQGSLQFESVDFDVRGLLEDVAEHYAPHAARKRLEIACVMDHDVPRIVNGDAMKLRQVLNNLMSNAVKFTDRGEVVLSAKVISEEDAGVVLQIDVTDTGIGIDEKEHSKLFRSFAQLENPECRAQAGAGLGLAICKQIVAGGGGYIDYYSTPGVGSSFWIVMRFGQAEYKLPPIPADPVVAGRKVLVIAASRAVRRMVRDHCRSLEMRTSEAENEIRATELLLEAARSGAPFDLVVGDGQTTNLARIALADPAGSRLILLKPPSRHGMEETWPAGVDAILDKPVREAQFSHTVKSLFTGPRAQAGVTQGADRLPAR